jgi:hypothetical protein
MKNGPREKKKIAKEKEDKPEEKKERVTNVPDDRPGHTKTSQEQPNDPHPL